MSELLLLASMRARRGHRTAGEDLGRRLAERGLSTVVLDLTPRAPKSRQRGLAGLCMSGDLIEALAGDGLDVGETEEASGHDGLVMIHLHPTGDDGADGPDEPNAGLATMLAKLLERHDRVIVAAPPAIAGRRCDRLLVIPSQNGICDVMRDLIGCLSDIGLVPEPAIADASSLLVAMVVGSPSRPLTPGASPREESAPDGAPTPSVTTSGLVCRTYYLGAETISSLQIYGRTLSERLGRHVKVSEIVGVAIATSDVLRHRELLGDREDGTPRTYYLHPPTISHLAQLALLASRALGRHVRLSDIVDLSVRHFLSQPLERQAGLILANRRKRDARA